MGLQCICQPKICCGSNTHKAVSQLSYMCQLSVFDVRRGKPHSSRKVVSVPNCWRASSEITTAGYPRYSQVATLPLPSQSAQILPSSSLQFCRTIQAIFYRRGSMPVRFLYLFRSDSCISRFSSCSSSHTNHELNQHSLFLPRIFPCLMGL